TARNGVTEVALFARLAARRVIVQHIGVMMGGANLDGAEEAAKLAAAAQVRLAGLKFMSASGAEGSPTARRVRIGLASGLDCAFHVTELEELEEALDLIALARTQLAGRETGAVARIEHGGVITAEHLTRLAALGAWVVTNPGFIHFRGAKYMAEPGLGEHLYPARSLKRAHVEIAGATDAPVTPPRPLAAIAAAVSRATLDGDVLGAEERLSTAEAFALFTHDAARLARLDAGVIAPQLSADLIVLARNPMELTPSELANLAVDITIIGGRVVYERGRPALAWSNSADLHTA
ncbi:MAG TPA: amidohydrolase family protein, partial [Candidatus Binataceae bacterium]|nr:amidohydrolase family protein [Candidatus Binataceae bacterium]